MNQRLPHVLFECRLPYCLLFFFLLTLVPAQESVPVSGIRPVEMKSVAIHGTIDVVVSTREGIVLASDSRVTRTDGSHIDDAQKLFPVGTHAACVIAGLVGADLGAQGFHLADTLG